MTTVFFLISLATLDGANREERGDPDLLSRDGRISCGRLAPFFSLSTISCHQPPCPSNPSPAKGTLPCRQAADAASAED